MKDLSTGSIPAHIATMSITMGIGILVQTLYFFIDLYFVSKLGDAEKQVLLARRMHAQRLVARFLPRRATRR